MSPKSRAESSIFATACLPICTALTRRSAAPSIPAAPVPPQRLLAPRQERCLSALLPAQVRGLTHPARRRATRPIWRRARRTTGLPPTWSSTIRLGRPSHGSGFTKAWASHRATALALAGRTATTSSSTTPVSPKRPRRPPARSLCRTSAGSPLPIRSFRAGRRWAVP